MSNPICQLCDNTSEKKILVDGTILFLCKKCRVVVDDRPALYPGDLPARGLKKKPSKYTGSDLDIPAKSNIPRDKKGKGKFCMKICEADVNDEIRLEYERMYSCRILDQNEVDMLKEHDHRIGLDKLDPFGTDEKYHEFLKQRDEVNIKSKGKIKVPLLPRITLNHRTEYRHCGHCKINIEIYKLVPLPKYGKVNDDNDPIPAYEELYNENSNILYRISTTTSETEGIKITAKIITQEELADRKLKEYKENMLEEQRSFYKFLYSNSLSPILDVNFRAVPTKRAEKLVKKMVESPSKNDPVNKQNPHNILKDRYDRGKIKVVSNDKGKIKYYPCVCCNQRTGPGLAEYSKKDSK